VRSGSSRFRKRKTFQNLRSLLKYQFSLSGIGQRNDVERGESFLAVRHGVVLLVHD
jgi:hypothetical protein